MLNKSTIITYPFLLLLSTGKKTFENLGRFIQSSGRKVANALQSAENSFSTLHTMSQSVFSEKKSLYLIIDDTLIKKIHATNMRGTGMFYDTKIGRCINAFRLVTALISDGKISIPIGCSYLFSKDIVDLCTERFPTKDEIAKAFVRSAIKLFPNIKIVLLADGLYSSVDLLRWCVENKIAAEMRMHSNRIVMHKGVKKKLSVLANEKGIRLTGRQASRTVSVEWHGIPLEITIAKRVNKNGKESIVYQVATYKAEPREHVKAYSIRWNTEKLNRTAKQSLGLGDCYSKNLAIQYNHVAASLLCYGIIQLEMKSRKLKTPEAAARAVKEEINSINFFHFIDQHSFSKYFDA